MRSKYHRVATAAPDTGRTYYSRERRPSAYTVPPESTVWTEGRGGGGREEEEGRGGEGGYVDGGGDGGEEDEEDNDEDGGTMMRVL